MSKKRIREIRRLCEEHGIEVENIRVNGRGHIVALTAAGPMTFATSPSDRRGMNNAKGDIRRRKRGMQS